MIKLEPFTTADFQQLINWTDSKELLIQIAGTYFSHPLTNEQLEQYLQDKNSMAFNVTDTATGKVIGHAEIILTGSNACKLDKLIIGDKEQRGKGIGQRLTSELLRYSFETLNLTKAELYVYDWNTTAIKAYEKVGFVIDYDKQLQTDFEDKSWKAFNMKIDKTTWQLRQQSL